MGGGEGRRGGGVEGRREGAGVTLLKMSLSTVRVNVHILVLIEVRS